jgi:prolyl-tRNA editing enzyme YbaK/EbsC (Cys-tRNA(Pro) deacylase)
VNNVQGLLEKQKIRYTIIEALPWVNLNCALTSAWISREQLARTTILSDGLMLYMVVYPSNRKLHPEIVGQKLKCELRPATREEIRRRLPVIYQQGCPPLSELCKITVVVDRLFDGLNEVYFPCGSHNRVVRVSGIDFMKLQQDAIYLKGISSFMCGIAGPNKRMKQCR